MIGLEETSLVRQPTPDYRAFHDGITAGTIDLSDPAMQVRYASVHLAAARRARAIDSPRLAEAASVLAAWPGLTWIGEWLG